MAIKNPENELNSTVENTFVTWSRQKGWNPLKIISGEGSYFTDSSGKSYLDMSSQLMCCHLGYGNKNVINAIKKQAETLSYIGPSFDTDIRETVSEKLKSILPDNMGKYFYGTSGTEANEAAMRYQNKDLVVFENIELIIRNRMVSVNGELGKYVGWMQ